MSKLSEDLKEKIRKMALENPLWSSTDIAEIINAGLPDDEEKVPARMVGVVIAKIRNPDRVNKPRKAKGDVEESEDEVDPDAWMEKEIHELHMKYKDEQIAALQGVVDKLLAARS